MPKLSEKDKIINFIVEVAENHLMDLSDDDAINEVVEEAVQKVSLVLVCRRGYEEIVPKSSVWRNDILSNIDDGRFKKMLRVNRQQFSYLVALLKNCAEFQGPHSCKQFPIELQLAIVLYRLGAYGENAAIRKIATIFGVGDGGTIDKITSRIFAASLCLQLSFVYWPDKTERDKIVGDTYNEMPYCIGYVDGTEIKLAESPVQEHIPYFSKSRCYSIKSQVVCDHQLRIRHFIVGHVGSNHDAKIYKSCALFKHPENLFSSFQWIAGDSAYPLSETVITPYRSNSQHLTSEERKAFNLRHSKYRVRIEHCLGILKERFGSMKELRIRIHNDQSRKLCCDWIRVCCILHNILLSPADLDTFCRNDESSEATEDNDTTFDNCGGGRNRYEIKRQAFIT